MELIVDRLTKQYQNKIAVDRINLKLNCGIYGLLGENGAGKTTFIRMLCGILKPTNGTVTFDGMDVSSEEYRAILGYLPQEWISFYICLRSKVLRKLRLREKLLNFLNW